MQSAGAGGQPSGGVHGRSARLRIQRKMSPAMAAAATSLPSNIELMVQVLSSDSIWTRARIWVVLSDVVWKAHSSEYSNQRTSSEVIAYYKGYNAGLYIQRLAKALCILMVVGGVVFVIGWVGGLGGWGTAL